MFFSFMKSMFSAKRKKTKLRIDLEAPKIKAVTREVKPCAVGYVPFSNVKRERNRRISAIAFESRRRNRA